MHHFSKLFAFIFLVGFAAPATAQKEETILGSRGLGLSGAWGGPRSQFTQFGETNSLINGGHYGLEFGNALLVGYGNYTLGTEVKWDDITVQDFNFKWGGPIIGYTPRSYRRVHPTFTLQAGSGNAWFKENEKDKIFVIQPGMGVELNIFRWLHIGVDGGYRFTTDANTVGLSDDQLSDAYGQLTIKFGYSWGTLRGRFKKKTREAEKS